MSSSNRAFGPYEATVNPQEKRGKGRKGENSRVERGVGEGKWVSVQEGKRNDDACPLAPKKGGENAPPLQHHVPKKKRRERGEGNFPFSPSTSPSFDKENERKGHFTCSNTA